MRRQLAGRGMWGQVRGDASPWAQGPCPTISQSQRRPWHGQDLRNTERGEDIPFHEEHSIQGQGFLSSYVNCAPRPQRFY